MEWLPSFMITPAHVVKAKMEVLRIWIKICYFSEEHHQRDGIDPHAAQICLSSVLENPGF
jgi:hypothetical protein